MALAIALHLLAAVYWVGGMLLMLLAVRPAAVALLEPPLRLPLLSAVLTRFFVGVWVAIAVLLGTGLWMLLSVFGGFAHAGVHIHGMFLLFLLMTAIFVYLFFCPNAVLKRALVEKNFPLAGAQMGLIRKLVIINASLGVVTLVVVSTGRSTLF